MAQGTEHWLGRAQAAKPYGLINQSCCRGYCLLLPGHGQPIPSTAHREGWLPHSRHAQ